MFVQEEARLEVAFAAARVALADLARGKFLLDASQAAYGEGVTGLAKVGPPGAWPDFSKLVMIHLGEVTAHDDSVRLPLRWEATGPGSSLFPALDADIVMTPDGGAGTTLTLTGVYRPPLGKLGAVLDRAILSRIAAATIRDFISRLGAAIHDASAAAEQHHIDEYGG